MTVVIARELNYCSKEVELLTKRFEDSCGKGEGSQESVYFLRTKVGIKDFMGRLCTHLKCNFETLVVAGVYLTRYAARGTEEVSRDTFFRMLFAATLVAIKLREDRFYSNEYYASVWGMPLDLANRIELDFLTGINWDLHITRDEYDLFLNP